MASYKITWVTKFWILSACEPQPLCSVLLAAYTEAWAGFWLKPLYCYQYNGTFVPQLAVHINISRGVLLPSQNFCVCFLVFLIFYLFIHERQRKREREREAEIQAEGETGSMQGALRGTQSRVSRITPRAEDCAKPLSHQGCPVF